MFVALMLVGNRAVINAEPIAPVQVAAAVAAATGTGEIPARPAGTSADSTGAYDASAYSIDASRSTSPATTAAAEPPTTTVVLQPQSAEDGGHQKVSVTADNVYI